MIRGRLIEMWREARKTMDPIAAWEWISQDPVRASATRPCAAWGLRARRLGHGHRDHRRRQCLHHQEVRPRPPDRLLADPGHVHGHAAGARYLSLLGGACLSFYDWYCDLPPASPQVWGEQTDVPESADWYNSTYLMVWGSNVPQTRTPDAHFYTEVRYKGTKTVAVSSDFGEMVKFGDIWLAPKQGTDAALAMAM